MNPELIPIIVAQNVRVAARLFEAMATSLMAQAKAEADKAKAAKLRAASRRRRKLALALAAAEAGLRSYLKEVAQD